MNASEDPHGWQVYYETSAIIARQDLWIITLLSAVQLVILGSLLWTDAKTKKPISTAVNILIASMIICYALTAIFFQLFLAVENNPLRQALFITATSLTNTGLECSVTYYVWKRGLPVIQATAPRLQPWFIAYLVLFGLVEVSKVVAVIFETLSEYLSVNMGSHERLRDVINGIVTVLSFSTIVFDGFVAVMYVKYLRTASNANLHELEKLEILSQFGIASCVVLEIWMVSNILYNFWTSCEVPPVGLSVYTTCLRVFSLSPLVYLFLQLGMKYALWKDDTRNSRHKNERVKNARRLSEQPSDTVGTRVSKRSGFPSSMSIQNVAT
ncbi:hypothetical protein BCR33DRAFT_524644 [Rhizoclosmatium globosum]|uniref:Uncharacterized protein n=1 Tax=Rhizoclosmatium globosum TaxID=329046 RepID=A0A1Y2CT74_9FUNG|nr:hypothetical protein BCR33DRAFT_524644 [Rhizoclosmatium globosum]|eukprot:ORY50229.1 hypothetical protein BCR33DRAFT_524644 [Rhizoclosmatium globosum]